MKYLFIDTSSDMLTLAIVDDNNIIAESYLHTKNDYSKYAMVELEKVFKQSELEPNDIDKLLVINGPGSFTGVRIGVTIAKTYAWSLNKPVIPISTLKAYSLSLDNYDYYVSVIDARRDHVYAAIYDKNYNNVLDETYIDIDKLNSFIRTLQGTVAITGNIDINDDIKTIPVKLNIIKIIAHVKGENENNVHELKPNYLKMVEAEEKLMGESI